MFLCPWMDIPTSSELGAPRSLSSQKLNVAWVDLLRTIDGYHAVRKDSLAKFQLRIRILTRQIGPKSEWVLQEMQRRSFELVLTSGSLQGVLDRYVRRQALAKAEYLGTMFTYLAQRKQELQDPHTLVRSLAQHHFRPAPPLPPRTGTPTVSTKGWVRTTPSSQLTEMTGRVTVERLDPYHRTGAEVTFTQGQIVVKNPDQQQLLGHLKAWIERLGQGYREPFFVFLEATSHCLGYDPKMSHEGLSVTRVQYQTSGPAPAPGTFGLLSFDDGGMVFEMLGNERRPFHTMGLGMQALPGKGVGSLKAYAWTSTGEIVTGVHEHGRLHHSSVGDGKPVRCAGMIGAEKGKIRFLSNDSGHYHPTPKQLWMLAKHLESRGVLHPAFEMDEAASRKTLRLSDLAKSAPDWVRGRVGITLGSHRKG